MSLCSPGAHCIPCLGYVLIMLVSCWFHVAFDDPVGLDHVGTASSATANTHPKYSTWYSFTWSTQPNMDMRTIWIRHFLSYKQYSHLMCYLHDFFNHANHVLLFSMFSVVLMFSMFSCFNVFNVYRCLFSPCSGTAAPAPPARRKSVARRAFNFLDKKLVAGGDEDDDDADALIVNARRGTFNESING